MDNFKNELCSQFVSKLLFKIAPCLALAAVLSQKKMVCGCLKDVMFALEGYLLSEEIRA